MTHIALIAGTYQPVHCGVAHYTAHLRHALSQQGVESTVLTTHQAAHLANQLNVQGVVHDWHLRDLLPLVQAIQAAKPDLLHIQHAAGTYGFQRAIFLLPLLLRLTGWNAPIVTTIHEYGWWEWHPRWIPPHWLEWLKLWGQQRGLWDREDGFLLTQSDAMITTNPDATQSIHARLPHLQSITHQIPIGINVDVAAIAPQTAREQLRQTCGWTEDTQVIVFFGFLHPVKGLETLLPAFKRVLAVQPNARLLLMGGVESLALPDEQATRYWNQLEHVITSLDLGETVCMTGYLESDEVSSYLTGADIGVLPFNHGVTLKSGSLLALMAHSLPIVATYSHPPDPGLSDLSNDVIRFVAPRHMDELVAALIHLLENPDMRSQLGARGRDFSDRFTWSSIAAAHLTIYQAVLAENAAPASKSKT